MQIKLENSPMSYDDFTYAFPKINHFFLLGSGYFADVFTKDNHPYVYKVASLGKNIRSLAKAIDDPYLAFLNATQEMDNPFFPRVRTLTIFKHQAASFYVAEMEKLLPLKNSKLDDASYAMRENLLHLFKHREHCDVLNDWKENAKIYKQYKNLIASQVYQTMAKLLMDYDNDLHQANMMMRQNGQLVITDPLCPKGMETPLIWSVRRGAQKFRR